MLLAKISLKRTDILLSLPPETEQLTRSTQSGLDISTLKSQTYNPVYGTVIKRSKGCKKVQNGDKCFFQIFTFSVAKERAYGGEQEDLANEYVPVSHFAFKEAGKWYMIISEASLYFFVRSATYGSYGASDKSVEIVEEKHFISVLNSYTLATPVDKAEEELISVKLKTYEDKQYELNTAKVFASSESWLNNGDIIKTLRFCDITMEEEYNHPILPDNFFIIESKNIICTMENNIIKKAGNKRVVVKPIITEQETQSGIIDTSIGKERLLKGTVIAVGEDCSGWTIGGVVLYARNSGMPVDSGEDELLILGDIDVFAEIEN